MKGIFKLAFTELQFVWLEWLCNKEKECIHNTLRYEFIHSQLNSQCYRQLLFKAPLCIKLKIKILVVASFFNFFKFFQKKKIYIYRQDRQ